MRLQNPKFIISAFATDQFPYLGLPEVAIIGRSNVGKSSLLNHLFHAKNLAKTSSTPGKTISINFFTAENHLAFADLPGYGFAQQPLEQKKKWGSLIESYLNQREELKLLLLLLDSRHDLSEDDEQMLEWVHFHHVPTIIVLTKIDKIPPSTRLTYTNELLNRIKEFPSVHYSIKNNEGRSQLLALMRKWLF